MIFSSLQNTEIYPYLTQNSLRFEGGDDHSIILRDNVIQFEMLLDFSSTFFSVMDNNNANYLGNLRNRLELFETVQNKQNNPQKGEYQLLCHQFEGWNLQTQLFNLLSKLEGPQDLESLCQESMLFWKLWRK